ncbi:MAG: CHAT domain-containing protein [Gammaproteobacteria bacterium]|nr:CHAT domain-containing protein [Gammaproteobacteria bacterium]
MAHPAFTAGSLATRGTDAATADFALAAGRTYLIEVTERDNDANVEVLDASGRLIVRADHPERRTGTRRAVVTAPEPGNVTVRVTGKEHANARGSAAVRVFELASVGLPECVTVLRNLAAADASYASGLEISSGRATSPAQSARDLFLRAEESYAAAEQALAATDDARLRGETELALAALNYHNLQDWSRTADLAKQAAAILAPVDAYRQARAEALMAAAWMEIGSAGSVEQSAKMLAEARAVLRRVNRFHMQRDERFDASLALTNIGLSYLYQGRYADCIAGSAAANRLLTSIHETLRAAQAWQNRSLCLWGLGRLSEARDGFLRSLADIPPQPLPQVYLASITNTALLDYSLGSYDDSLRLYDRALAFAQRTQDERDSAYCLYGIGVNYAALGDPERAREFLMRSLTIRTVAFDGRGRMDTLRALARVDGEEGKLEEAIGYDQEALTLAVDPLAQESIRVQLATHTASAGHFEEAKSLLDEVLEKGPRGDPLILADARVQRAVIYRRLGRTNEALVDLRMALGGFHALSSVSQEFAGRLELARTLRQAGNAREALVAVDRALALGDAVRVQSVNPDFRVQLQAPLRAAYDLKIELLRSEYDAAVLGGRTAHADALAAKAFAAADSSRAHSFADVAAQEYSPALRRELASELHRRESLYRELAERRFALDYLIDPSPSRNPRAKKLLSDIAELERQADTLNTVIARRAAHSGEPAAGARRSIPVMPANTGLISYWLGAESSYAWVVLPGELHWVRLAEPKVIEKQATAFHDSLTHFMDQSVEQRLTAGARVSEFVLHPLESWLSGVNQWVIVPDGVLDYIPFAALEESSNPQSFVVLRHDVALTPAAWMLGATDDEGNAGSKRGLLLVDDPVYEGDDPRLAARQRASAAPAPGASPDVYDYRRLLYTAQEAAAIRRLFPPSEVDELAGLDATRERFLASDLSRYRFIHVAAHGTVDTRVPELSALVLGSYDASGRTVDGAVRVPDLALLRLHADVAVFSACDTAMGEEVASEGLVGIGSTVLARGVRAVVGSLWPVSDEIGAQLMTEFYRHLLRDSMSAPAALAAAMRSVVSRERAADPALWAAFQVSVVALGPGRPSRNGGLKVSTKSAEGGTL